MHIDNYYGTGHAYFSGEQVYGDECYISDENMDERWWFIDSAPDYMISDHGRVWSGKSQAFVKPKPMDKHGHLGVCLSVNGRPRYEYIHRLMAKAFIPNPNRHPIVRHLNDYPDDNYLENLAWGTQKDNMRDCIDNGHAHFVTPEEREIGLAKARKPIIAINIRTGVETIFNGQGTASRELGIQQSNIWKVLNGERSSAGGYCFKYLKDGDV